MAREEFVSLEVESGQQPEATTTAAADQVQIGNLSQASPGSGLRSFLSRSGARVGAISAAVLVAFVVTVIVVMGRHRHVSDPLPGDGRWPGRLPLEPKPLSQSIHLEVSMTSFAYRGTTWITVHNGGGDRVSEVHFHAGDNLSVGDVTLDGVRIPSSRVRRVREYDFYVVEEGIDPGRTVVLEVAFEAPIADTLGGFYRSAYANDDGDEEWIAVTDFEPVDARRAFPCFDEPALKAEFSVTIDTEKGFSVLNNMPRVPPGEAANPLGLAPPPSGMERWVFEETPLMSTYLVCFSVNRFSSVSLVDPRGVRISAWGRPSELPKLQFAVHMANFSLTWFAGAFGTPYKLPKLDLLAVPNFEAGAMENWGLVTFRAVALLAEGKLPPTLKSLEIPTTVKSSSSSSNNNNNNNNGGGGSTSSAVVSDKQKQERIDYEIGHGGRGDDPSGSIRAAKVRRRERSARVPSSASSIQYVAIVISHELAHMWFGDLVTPEWWNYLWLNEAFAAYMEALPVAAAFEEWKIPEQFIVDNIMPSMRADALPSSHAIQSPVQTPQEIRSSFDAIVYEKGASVIRMMALEVGHDTFLNGVREYISDNAYATGTTAKLLDRISLASKGTDVSAFMDQFLATKGYPAVVVRETASGSIVATQQRFSYGDIENAMPDSSEKDTLWKIPIILRKSGVEERIIMEGREITLVEKWDGSCGTAPPVHLSPDHSTYMLALYSPKLLACLSSPIDAGVLHDASRAAFSSGFSRDDVVINTATVLGLMKGLAQETDYAVWAVAASTLRHLLSLAGRVSSETLPQLEEFVRGVVGPQSTRLGWDDPQTSGLSHADSLLRPIVQSLAAEVGAVDARARALVIWERYTATGDQSVIPADLRSTVLRCAIEYAPTATLRTSNTQRVVTILGDAQRNSDPSGVGAAMVALGSAGWREKGVMDMLLRNPSRSVSILDQDIGHFLQYVTSSGSEGASAALSFMDKHWDDLSARYPARGIAKRVVGQVANPSNVQLVRSIYAEHGWSALGLEVERAMELMAVNVDWVAKGGLASMAGWLDSQGK